MRSTTLFMIAVAICLCSITYSQSAPVLAHVDSNPDGTATLTIRNDSDVSLVAFVDVEESHPVASDGKQFKVTLDRYWDVATDITLQPVAPHRDIGILTGTPGYPPQATLMAALFADGSSFGDSAWIQNIVRRRQMARKGFDTAFSLLEKGMQEAMPRAELIERLAASKDRSAQDASGHEEIDWATRYHRLIIHNLTKNTHAATGELLSDRQATEAMMSMLRVYRDRFELYGVHFAAPSHETAQ